MVIHDLRNPTVSIKLGLENTRDLLGQIEQLKDHSLEFNAMQQKLVQKINQECESLSNLGDLARSADINLGGHQAPDLKSELSAQLKVLKHQLSLLKPDGNTNSDFEQGNQSYFEYDIRVNETMESELPNGRVPDSLSISKRM